MWHTRAAKKRMPLGCNLAIYFRSENFPPHIRKLSFSFSFSPSLSTLSLGRKLYNLPDELAVGYLSRLSIRSALFSPRSFFFPFVCLAVFFFFSFFFSRMIHRARTTPQTTAMRMASIRENRRARASVGFSPMRRR